MKEGRLETKHDVAGIIDMIERSRKCNLVQSGQCTEKEVEEHPELWESRFNNKERDSK